ncbi:MAG: 50S ribosomal protein L7/L12 [Clostridia bacterium]
MASKVEQVLEIVRDMKVTELSELVSAFEEEFGVSAAAPVAAVAGAGAVEAGAAEAEEEQTEFDVVLTSAGDKKIPVIKVVREITGLGLKEAKALVDDAGEDGSPVKEGVSSDEAEDLKRQLEEVGASVEIR